MPRRELRNPHQVTSWLEEWGRRLAEPGEMIPRNIREKTGIDVVLSMSVAEPRRWRLLMHDQARLEYGRLLWKRPRGRARLLRHWTDSRHPYAERSAEFRPWVEQTLAASAQDDDALDAALRTKGLSLRVVVREIPPVIGSFYRDSAEAVVTSSA